MHKTPHAAKLAAPHTIYQPALVLLADGSYDTYPVGHPLPDGAVIIARKQAYRSKSGSYWHDSEGAAELVAHSAFADKIMAMCPEEARNG